MTTRRVELDITEVSELLYDLILEHFRTKFGRDAVFDNWEISADMEEVSKWDEDRINAVRRSMGWVAEDHPEATEEQKANLVKLFREV